MKKYILLLIIFVTFLLSACSPSYRLNRILKLHPELLKQDTVYTKYEVVTPQIELDTFFFINDTDTIILEKEKLKIEFVKILDTIKIKAKCETDTIYIDVPHYYTKYVEKEEDVKKYTFLRFKMLLYVMVIVVLLPHFLDFLKHFKKT